MKKLQIEKVFRKDIPYPERCQFCEFYQADIDIIGNYAEMIPEAEIIKLITSVLDILK